MAAGGGAAPTEHSRYHEHHHRPSHVWSVRPLSSPYGPRVTEPVGVSGVVAALSVASDLTRGHPPGEAMRACLLATELARRSGLDASRQNDVYYGTLLRFAGCAATSHELAAVFGDDVAVRARGDLVDLSVPDEAMEFLAGLGVDAVRL